MFAPSCFCVWQGLLNLNGLGTTTVIAFFSYVARSLGPVFNVCLVFLLILSSFFHFRGWTSAFFFPGQSRFASVGLCHYFMNFILGVAIVFRYISPCGWSIIFLIINCYNFLIC